MLDVKKSLTKILNKIDDLSQPTTCTNVSLPFTPTSNGLLIVLFRANAQGRVYELYNNTRPTIVDAYQIAGGYSVATLFVWKGLQVSVSSSANIMNHDYYFIPLVGGVVHKLLSLTISERGWAVC